MCARQRSSPTSGTSKIILVARFARVSVVWRVKVSQASSDILWRVCKDAHLTFDLGFIPSPWYSSVSFFLLDPFNGSVSLKRNGPVAQKDQKVEEHAGASEEEKSKLIEMTKQRDELLLQSLGCTSCAREQLTCDMGSQTSEMGDGESVDTKTTEKNKKKRKKKMVR